MSQPENVQIALASIICRVIDKELPEHEPSGKPTPSAVDALCILVALHSLQQHKLTCAVSGGGFLIPQLKNGDIHQTLVSTCRINLAPRHTFTVGRDTNPQIKYVEMYVLNRPLLTAH